MRVLLTHFSNAFDIVDNLDHLGGRIRSRVCGEQAIDVGHEEKEVGMAHGGSDGREGIIIAKLDLGHRNGIVLIDDRDDSRVQEGAEGG